MENKIYVFRILCGKNNAFRKSSNINSILFSFENFFFIAIANKNKKHKYYLLERELDNIKKNI